MKEISKKTRVKVIEDLLKQLEISKTKLLIELVLLEVNKKKT